MDKFKMQNINNGFRLSVVGKMKKVFCENRKPNTPLEILWNFKDQSPGNLSDSSGEHRSGFSFIELMTVVAIVAILIAVSMPLFRNFTRGRNLKEGTNMVVFALRKARNAAITERKMYRAVLDTVNNAVAIYVDNDIVNPAENWRGLTEFVEFDITNTQWYVGNTSAYQNKYAPPSDHIFWVEFKSTGTLDGVGFNEQRIVLKETSTEETRLVTVNALTGKIGVE